MYKHKPQDLKIFTGELPGFFRSVVEDNDDPLKAGRVRVRIWGLHTQKTVKDNKEGIPTNELPWAEPCIPITEGGVNGYGLFGVPVQGSHVLVVFEHNNPLRPLYFASLPGSGDWNKGAGTYPNNVVLAVHGGHYIELDSSPGNMRININHKSGTKIEINEAGDMEINAVGKIDMTGNLVDVDGGGGSLKGIVNGDSICPLTGSPHMHISSDTKCSIGA